MKNNTVQNKKIINLFLCSSLLAIPLQCISNNCENICTFAQQISDQIDSNNSIADELCKTLSKQFETINQEMTALASEENILDQAATVIFNNKTEEEWFHFIQLNNPSLSFSRINNTVYVHNENNKTVFSLIIGDHSIWHVDNNLYGYDRCNRLFMINANGIRVTTPKKCPCDEISIKQ